MRKGTDPVAMSLLKKWGTQYEQAAFLQTIGASAVGYQGLLDRACARGRWDAALWLLERLGPTEDVLWLDKLEMTRGLVYAGSLRVRGYVRASGPVLVGGDLTVGWFLHSGCVEAGGDVTAGWYVDTDGYLRAGGTLRAGGFVRVGGTLRAGAGICAGGPVETGGLVLASAGACAGAGAWGRTPVGEGLQPRGNRPVQLQKSGEKAGVR